jgi:hypothetical protein
MRPPIPPHAHERTSWRSSEGSWRRSGRCRRAQRSAAGATACRHSDQLLDAGRSAFVTPAGLPAAPARAGRVGLAGVAESSALPPSEDEGAGAEECCGTSDLHPVQGGLPRDSSAARDAPRRWRAHARRGRLDCAAGTQAPTPSMGSRRRLRQESTAMFSGSRVASPPRGMPIRLPEHRRALRPKRGLTA